MTFIPGDAGRSGRVRLPGVVTLAVWRALFLREVSARLFAGRASWAWLLIEPVAHALLLMILFATLRDRSVEGVADFAPFLLVGIMGFQVFRIPATRCMGAVDSSRALFIYRQLKPIDTVLVRGLVDGLIQALLLVVLLIGLVMWGYEEAVPFDAIGFIVTFGLLWLLGWGLGMILSAGTLLGPEFARLAGLIFMPLYFLSGIFYRPQRAPPEVRDWLLLNPVLHGIDIMRSCMFPGYHVLAEISLGYVLFCALACVFLGLALQLRFARRLASQ